MNRLQELYEAIDGLKEQYGDMLAEYKGEVARFGDAWPGAWQDLRNLETRIDALEKEASDLQVEEDYNQYEDAEMYPGGAGYNDVMGYNDIDAAVAYDEGYLPDGLMDYEK